MSHSLQEYLMWSIAYLACPGSCQHTGFDLFALQEASCVVADLTHSTHVVAACTGIKGCRSYDQVHHVIKQRESRKYK